MFQKIEPFDYAHHILSALQKGVLLTTRSQDTVNTMTISWGTLGVQWGVPLFTVFVRGSRRTAALLDETGEFTVNLPWGEYDREILRFCGSHSCRDTDKIAALGLQCTPPQSLSVPGIRQLPLTLECRVLYRQLQCRDDIRDESVRSAYAEDADPRADFHTAYYGKIEAAYLTAP